ncbi:MAG TPA: dCTP deaminase [Chloroflexota bacterium]|nr:dCTP deaminase [Chloroflexota bacterium]
MSILTHEVIWREIAARRIVVDPFLPDQVGPASIDLHLGNTFWLFENRHVVHEVCEESDFTQLTHSIETDQGVLLQSGETVLGLTRERVTLAPSLCGWLEGRSRFARLGLAVHVTAGFMQPGIDNRQVLEMTNLGPTPLQLRPGVRICQLVIERCEGEATYRGRFVSQ